MRLIRKIGLVFYADLTSVRAALMLRMNGTSRCESRDGLGRAKQDARAESTWMCGAKPPGDHISVEYKPC